MNAPDRLADRIAFHEEYIPSNRKQRVSRATGIQYTGSLLNTHATVTEWTEREEDVPGSYETYIVEMWYEKEGILAHEMPLWKLDKDREHAYLHALMDQNPDPKDASPLMGVWIATRGWGHPGFSFWVTHPQQKRPWELVVIDDNNMELTWT